MITAKDLHKLVQEDSPIYDEFIECYLIPAFQKSLGDVVKIHKNDISYRYLEVFNNGRLVRALQYRGFGANKDQLDGVQFLQVFLPPQEE